MTLRAELIGTLDGAQAIAAEWDALAVAAGRPYCAPGWLLPWWRHVAPARSQLRLIAVRDEAGLAGLAPFYAYRWRGLWAYALLGTDVSSRVEPLVRADRAEEATRAIAAALAAAEPAPAVVQLWGLPADANWPDRLCAAWPGRAPFVHRRPAVAAPTVTLDADDIDAWFARRSTNFRGQMRRFRRKLDKEGAVFRVTEDPARIAADLAELERLHRLRLDDQTDAFPPGARQMLVDAGRELLPENRFRLASIELDGEVISSHLFVAAGRELSFWNAGFDERFASMRPAYVGLVDAVAAGLRDGYERFDLGAGAQDYKYRFADGEDQLEWTTLIPAGARYVPARAAYAPDQARYAVTTRLSAEQKQRLRDLLSRAAAVRPRRGRSSAS